MDSRTIRIATRRSPLAQCQSLYVADALRRKDTGLSVQLLPMVTEGDRISAASLADAGGKRLFVKALETALLEGAADIAVHSLKDLPVDLPSGLVVAAVMARASPADAFVSNRFSRLADLPDGAVVGTSSLRRASQLMHYRSTLRIRPLRGNVGTRLDRLDSGDYDAIVLACAGLERLGHAHRIVEAISSDTMLPAIGQGAIAIECLPDSPVHALVRSLNDEDSERCAIAERTLSRLLGGECRLPMAAHAVRDGERIYLRALVGDLAGKCLLRAEARASLQAPQEAGAVAAQSLLGQGAAALLAEVKRVGWDDDGSG